MVPLTADQQQELDRFKADYNGFDSTLPQETSACYANPKDPNAIHSAVEEVLKKHGYNLTYDMVAAFLNNQTPDTPKPEPPKQPDTPAILPAEPEVASDINSWTGVYKIQAPASFKWITFSVDRTEETKKFKLIKDSSSASYQVDKVTQDSKGKWYQLTNADSSDTTNKEVYKVRFYSETDLESADLKLAIRVDGTVQLGTEAAKAFKAVLQPKSAADKTGWQNYLEHGLVPTIVGACLLAWAGFGLYKHIKERRTAANRTEQETKRHEELLKKLDDFNAGVTASVREAGRTQTELVERLALESPENKVQREKLIGDVTKQLHDLMEQHVASQGRIEKLEAKLLAATQAVLREQSRNYCDQVASNAMKDVADKMVRSGLEVDRNLAAQNMFQNGSVLEAEMLGEQAPMRSVIDSIRIDCNVQGSEGSIQKLQDARSVDEANLKQEQQKYDDTKAKQGKEIADIQFESKIKELQELIQKHSEAEAKAGIELVDLKKQREETEKKADKTKEDFINKDEHHGAEPKPHGE